ncbi:MAG: hypothetical protein EPO47_05040 [Rugosibacter sp.]|nr:MAG: hypothetical protein EPO47_05040 [Rugosibacter sp.]
MDEKFQNLHCEEVEVDELWGFVAKKQKHVSSTDDAREVGDQYIFVALDANTKLVPTFLVGKRSAENAVELMRDLQYRVANRPTITTDGFRPYIEAEKEVLEMFKATFPVAVKKSP